MSFSWLFAIIVGMIILVLVIYGVNKGFQGGQVEQSALIGKEISVLLNPLETSFEAGKTSSLSLSSDTRLYNKCDNFGGFGTQYLEVSQKSFGEWVKTDFDITFSNKYIFSDNYVEGKKFYFFSKPFEFPFKVADVIYMTSASDFYCFEEFPEDMGDVEEELTTLNQENIQVGECGEENFITICFEYGSNCDINVNYNSKSVEKQGEEVYFETDDNRLDIYLQQPDRDASPLEMASGAEKTVAAMAIRLAFTNISSLPKSQIFVLDEPGTALDEERMEGFVRILDITASVFKTVILISHLDSLKDSADSIIIIEKKDGYANVVA